MHKYLQPTPTVDCDHAAVIAFAKKHSDNHADPRERSVRLYYAVRDGIRYDPYSADLSVEGLRASTTLSTGRGWCVAKAVLLAACCRAVEVPARLGFADVRNHLSTARLRKYMSDNVFYWHGYTAIYLDGIWLKATPAFNIELCRKFRLKPLDFDGRTDAIYHPFDIDGNRHMEYLQYHGEFVDVPIDQIAETFGRYTPDPSFKDADFEKEVEIETSSE